MNRPKTPASAPSRGLADRVRDALSIGDGTPPPSAPSSEPSSGPLATLGTMLRDLRRVVLVEDRAPADACSPEDDARIVMRRAMHAVFDVFEQFRSRRERGERCRIVVREKARTPGRTVIELAIEVAEGGS